MVRVRALVIASLVAATIAVAGPQAVAGPGEGCTALPGIPCSYTATEGGGIVAGSGHWEVKIDRGGSTRTYRGWGPEVIVGVIRAGDRVSAWSGTVFIDWTEGGLWRTVGNRPGFVRVGPESN